MKAKLAKEIDRLFNKYDEIRLDEHGGYPGALDYKTIPGYVIFANNEGSGGNEPRLRIFKLKQVEKWLKDTVKLQEKARKAGASGDPDFVMCALDTMPKSIN